jgi:hypothetical protein
MPDWGKAAAIPLPLVIISGGRGETIEDCSRPEAGPAPNLALVR